MLLSVMTFFRTVLETEKQTVLKFSEATVKVY